MIEAVEDARPHQLIERGQIHHHAGLRVHRPPDQHLHHVVVPVTVGIVAFAIDGLVFFHWKRISVQPVAGAHQVAAAKVGSHSSPRYSAKISGVS